MRSLAILLALVGCVDEQTSSEPAEPNQLRDDGKADGGGPLWAGLTSITFERYAPDPCNNGATALGDAPAVYDEWVRQRAGVRNICFEVWAPGVTDTENPDYWKLLDVQVHYRFGDGAWQSAYVSSNGRRFNNRRYQWTIDYALDPIANAGSLVAVGAPLRIVSEHNDWAIVQKDLQVYFTVNGRVLNSPSNHPFTIRYEGQAREPSLATKADGYVLGDIVTCDGMRVGWGAGYFGLDIRDPGAIAALTTDAIYGAPVARSNAIVSTIFSSQFNVPGETLPSWRDSGGARVTPSGNTLRVEFDVYDRNADAVRTLMTTFHGCVAH